MMITYASQLSNGELEATLKRLAGGEREATVALIVHLAEFDSRRLYAPAGFSSLFCYCVEVLRLSEDAAYNRIESARAARRYPVILEMLATGALSPTTARLLARKLTPENHRELLAAAAGMTKQQVEQLLACRFPQPDVPSSVRRVPTREVLRPRVAVPAGARLTDGAAADTPEGPAAGPQAPLDVVAPPQAPPRPIVRPLAPERYEIRFTGSAETLDCLRMAQDLLGHAVPNGDLAPVFDRALVLLVDDLARKKFADTKKPQQSRGRAEDSRNIPAAVQRMVWIRDRGRCAYVASSGRRCEARRFIEFHHMDPYGADGKPTVDRVQLRCGTHNRYEAELFYGPGREYGGVGILRDAAAPWQWRPGQEELVPERVRRVDGGTDAAPSCGLRERDVRAPYSARYGAPSLPCQPSPHAQGQGRPTTVDPRG